MKINKTCLAGLVLITASFSVSVLAQGDTPLTITVPGSTAAVVAKGNDLYCAGFIQSSPIATGNRIIGAQHEADGYLYGQNDFMYINMGADKGVNVGDVFSVIRPRGSVQTKWTNKGNLGSFVQELGSLEVLKVKANMSAVKVKWSCDNFLLGDLVQLRERRTSPSVNNSKPMDVFGDPSGKATGRIVLARDGVEAIAKNFIVYVDLGADDQVKVGDKLTIFRPLASGNVTNGLDRELVSSRDYGFQSDIYKGGKFSNQSARKSGENSSGQEVRTRDVRNNRPSNMRKVVGEAVVLNVKEKTATVIITRNAQEIHTGDWVEIQ